MYYLDRLEEVADYLEYICVAHFYDGILAYKVMDMLNNKENN